MILINSLEHAKDTRELLLSITLITILGALRFASDRFCVECNSSRRLGRLCAGHRARWVMLAPHK